MPLPAEERKGINGRSLLLDIPGFNFITDLPCEYLHSVNLGVVKRFIEQTFANIREKRTRLSKTKLCNPADFNTQMRGIKVPREFSRRSRSLDYSVMKGQEFRNIILFFFPIVLNCFEHAAKERKLWLYLVYMIRSCILPDNEYASVGTNVIQDCCNKFYKLYETLFGQKNCTYYTHVVASHLLQMRTHGPLTFTSAFGFESFYGEMCHSFVPKTISPLKQIMQNILLKRTLAPHCCTPPIHYSATNTALENNNTIYTYLDNRHYIYQIDTIVNDTCYCKKIGQFQATFPELPAMSWNEIGIYRKGGVGNKLVPIKINTIAGKVLTVQNLLITCPTNVLEEK